MRRNILKLVFVMAVAMILFNGCGGPIMYNYAGAEGKKLMGYLSDGDAESFKAMFCEKTQSTDNFDEQIQMAMDFFDGKIISWDDMILSGGEEESTRKGKTVIRYISPQINDIKTDTGKTYEILFYGYLVNAEHEDYVGISELHITADDGSECVVGEFTD
ncbi:MAG: DUF5104 domain-containing protein [Lachnospiraceae bacterium]|nr:DUF5104 domain-containing protein [Lachnospiraceae bacterium]